MGVFSHAGKRVICFCLPGGPTIAVRSSNASSLDIGSSLPPTKSEKDGPVFRRSLNDVDFLRGLSLVA
jgi:hypothetical protein